jgi:hypothetical protein
LPEPMNPARATTDMYEARVTLEVYRRERKVKRRAGSFWSALFL